MGVPIWKPKDECEEPATKKQRIGTEGEHPSYQSSFLRQTSLRRHNAIYGDSMQAARALRVARDHRSPGSFAGWFGDPMSSRYALPFNSILGENELRLGESPRNWHRERAYLQHDDDGLERYDHTQMMADWIPEHRRHDMNMSPYSRPNFEPTYEVQTAASSTTTARRRRSSMNRQVHFNHAIENSHHRASTIVRQPTPPMAMPMATPTSAPSTITPADITTNNTALSPLGPLSSLTPFSYSPRFDRHFHSTSSSSRRSRAYDPYHPSHRRQHARPPMGRLTHGSSQQLRDEAHEESNMFMALRQDDTPEQDDCLR